MPGDARSQPHRHLDLVPGRRWGGCLRRPAGHVGDRQAAVMAITKGQMEAAQRIADKQVMAPMRQAWINDLRKLLAEVLSASLHYYVAGYENRSDADYGRMSDVQQQIELMLNPTEDLHRGLVKAVSVLVAAIEDEEVSRVPRAAPARQRTRTPGAQGRVGAREARRAAQLGSSSDGLNRDRLSTRTHGSDPR